MGGDLYELLGVKKDASADAVKRAYHDKARKYHPDINSDRINADYFLDIQAAYDILKDPIKRKKYDDRIDDEDFGVPIVKCQISSSRRVIPRLDEDQLVYALMKVECLKQSEELNEPQVHVCLVIDKSTSMHGKRIDMVKANVVQLIATLNERDLISIVTFSDQAEVLLPPTNIANAKLIITKINQISTDGATEIKAGLKTGLDLLWQGQENQHQGGCLLSEAEGQVGSTRSRQGG